MSDPIEQAWARESPAHFATLVSRGGWQIKDAPHLRMLNEKLLDVANGRILRLIITMQPRHGKSEFTSKYFPAWVVGCWPDKRVILASYAAEFAEEWGGKARDIVESHGQRLFGISVRHNSKAAARWVMDGHKGG